MDVQLSVLFLFIFFNAGHSLDCFECSSLTESCADQEVTKCPELHTCFSSTIVAPYGDNTKLKVKGCIPSYPWISGDTNISIPNMSLFFCNTDLCNAQDAPDPSVDSSSTIINIPNISNIPNLFDVPNVADDLNGKRCYSCDGQNCSYIMDCSGSEDHCITATGNFKSLPAAEKGCASKDYCDYLGFLFNGQGITCCEGDLCNSVDSVTQSVTQNPDSTSVTQNVTQSVSQNNIQSISQNVTQNPESTQSITQSVSKNVTQSISQINPRNLTQSVSQNVTQNPDSTQSITQSISKIVTQRVSQNNTQSVTHSVSQINTRNATQNVTQSPDSAQSVTQSFLFLCCSLLSFILLH